MTISNSSVPCYPVRDAVSNGAFQGNNPIHFGLPLLIIQIVLVQIVTRCMAFLFKPFRQPRVLAEIIGGVLLGPSALGRNKTYLNAIFPKDSLTLLDTIATLGLIFFLFMVGMELDLKELRKSGKMALLVAFAGICVPFMGAIGVSTLLHHTISAGTKFGPLIVFVGVPLSITAFPVLVRILAERKLLATELGKLVVPAAAINDVCAWILLAIGVALSGTSSNPLVPVLVLLCGLAYVVFMLLFARRLMEWIAHRATSDQQTVSEIYVCVTMVGVLIAGFTTDAIGIHPLFGAFVFGLIVPKDGTFVQMLIEKIEDFVTVMMLPLFFASSGLKTNLGSLNSARSFGLLVLLFLTASIGKISATVAVAVTNRMQLRTAFAFGFLMNTKGLVELIVLNIGKDLGVLNDQTFAILVLTCLFAVFFTTPAVVALYKPARNAVPYTNRKLESFNNRKDELRILACVHGARNIPGLLNLVEACRGTKKRPLKLYAMHLVELSDRPSAIMTMNRARKYGRQPASRDDDIFVAFEAYGQLTKVTVKPMTVMSELADMHEDVCNMAAERRATLIILPFNFYQREDGTIEHINSGFRTVNQKVFQHAPCSVGVLVDKGLWGSSQLSEMSPPDRLVAMIFFGGADDREALAFGRQLSEHPNVKLWVLRILIGEDPSNCVISIIDQTVQSDSNTPLASRKSSPTWVQNTGGDQESGVEQSCQEANVIITDQQFLQDEESLAAMKAFTGEISENTEQSIFYEEHTTRNPVEMILGITKSSGVSLFLLGRRGCPPSFTATTFSNLLSAEIKQNYEHCELGLVGDALASVSGDMKASILVIQQHNDKLECLP